MPPSLQKSVKSSKNKFDICPIEELCYYGNILTNGVPMDTLSKLLGHKSIKTTQRYVKMVDKKVSEDMKALSKYYQVIGLNCLGKFQINFFG